MKALGEGVEMGVGETACAKASQHDREGELREGQCGWKVRKGQERRASGGRGGAGVFSTYVAVQSEMGCECQIHTGF